MKNELNFYALEQNLMDIIKEEQAKLGYQKERIRLYYPLSSLHHLLECEDTVDEMVQHLQDFCQTVSSRLGMLTISHENERFCFSIPEAGTEYVHTHTKPNEFIHQLVAVLSRHNCTMEDIFAVFHSHSEQVHIEEGNHSEFDFLVYFEQGVPDNYRYCFHQDEFHIIYHRYLPEDYEDLELD